MSEPVAAAVAEQPSAFSLFARYRASGVRMIVSREVNLSARDLGEIANHSALQRAVSNPRGIFEMMERARTRGAEQGFVGFSSLPGDDHVLHERSGVLHIFTKGVQVTRIPKGRITVEPLEKAGFLIHSRNVGRDHCS